MTDRTEVIRERPDAGTDIPVAEEGQARCICPDCGHVQDALPGQPCIETRCPDCRVFMRDKIEGDDEA